jgi:DNA polymerase-3 subunit epsilon
MKEILLESTFVSVDIETTGFDEENADIIEIACVRVEGGVITEKFSSLVNPGYLLPERIVKLTGITNAMIVGKPSIYEVLPKFLKFIEDSVIVGHNIEKDIAFIDKAYRTLYGKRFKHPHICTLNLARNILPYIKKYSLKDLADYFNIKYRRLHRALDDAETTAYLFIELLNLLWNQLKVGDYLEIKKISKA